MPPSRDARIVRSLVRWFRASARELPWRPALGARRDAYRVLVSELMLQQTQASRVAERFDRFIDRFPTIETLAGADETEVLAEWSGLGYYRRARMLHGAAREVVGRRDGRFPRSASAIAELPGVGRYTAGAIASLAFHERTPAVDANVTRVVLRLEGERLAVSDRAAGELAWRRAGELIECAPRAGSGAAVLNESLIELGALVCAPRSPRCDECPLRSDCRGHAEGIAKEIPVRKSRPDRSKRYFASVIIRDESGRVSVTRRPSDGLWAGLFEAPTVERADRAPRAAEIRRGLCLPSNPRRLGSFPFQTTHRDCRFDIYECAAPASPPDEWRFLHPAAIAELGLSTPQRRILLELAAAGADAQ